MKNIKAIIEGILFGFAVFFIINIAPWFIGGTNDDGALRIFQLTGFVVGVIFAFYYIFKSLKK